MARDMGLSVSEMYSGRHSLEPRAAEYINTRGRSTYSNVLLSVGVLTNDTQFLAF